MGSQCGGHFSYMPIRYPIPKPVFIRNITKLLELYCPKCKTIDVPDRKRDCRCVKPTRKVTYEQGVFVWHLRTGERISQKKGSVIATTAESFVVIKESALDVIEITRTHFDSDDVRSALGFSNIGEHRVRLEDCFFGQYIPISPNSARPDGESGTGSRVTNFVTFVYRHVILSALTMNMQVTHKKADGSLPDDVFKAAMKIYNAMRLISVRMPRTEYEAVCRGLEMDSSIAIPRHQDFKVFCHDCPARLDFSAKTHLENV